MELLPKLINRLLNKWKPKTENLPAGRQGRKLITDHWPLLILLFTVIAISITNHKSDTYLMGGDNLMPELNFPVNIQRSLFAAWQEYQGLGLLGGMGHASDLLHQLVLLLLSVFLPNNVLRYTWTMLMLLVGSIGAYYLIGYLLEKIVLKGSTFDKVEPSYKTLALAGALFYLLNFSTIQTFYIPFEVFTAHFGFLPWLLLSGIMYFQKQTRKTLVFFVLVLIVATPAAYVPTLFVVYLMALTILLGTLLICRTRRLSPLSLLSHMSPLLKIYLIIFLINAFWLLPFLYFTITHSQVVLQAKINQMATESIIYRNIEFGDLFNVFLLRGFWLNNVTPLPNGTSIYVFDAWRSYLANPFVTLSGLVLFALTVLGSIFSLKTKKPLAIAFVILCVLSIIVLTTNTPPFSWIDFVLREYVPLFKEVFRFPFTKFSILASLSYAVLLPFGIYQVIVLINKRREQKYLFPTIVASSILLIFISIFPIFRGHFFFSKEQAAVPKEYAALFDFFNHQDPNTRIADFPQNVFWGWTYTNWNYDGSGFLWYGIKQPILDRAFDVWSRNDENYYWELATALSTQDSVHVDKILQKYQISWLVVDKNDFYAYDPKADISTPLEKLLHNIPNIHKVKSFGNIDVYAYDLGEQEQTYISAKQQLPNSNSYRWSNTDQVYNAYGDYQTNTANDMTVYPYRSLFTNKSESDQTFTLHETANTITFSTLLDQKLSNNSLVLPQMYEGIPTDVVAKIGSDGLLNINLVLHSPKISMDNKELYNETMTQTLFRIPKEVSYPFTLVINNTDAYSVPYANKKLGTSLLSSQQQTGIELKEDALHFDDRITFAPNQIAIPLIYRQPTTIHLPATKVSHLEISTPKATNPSIMFRVSAIDEKRNVYNCNNFRKGKALGMSDNGMLQLYAQDATPCLAIFASQLRYDTGYALFVNNTYKKGQALHVWLDNPIEKSAPLDTLMPTEQRAITGKFIIPPITTPGIGYGIHLDEDAYGSAETINDIGSIRAYPIPYQFLTHITIGNGTPIIPSSALHLPMTVTHPNESLYGLSFTANNVPADTTLILSQSFDSGWRMYQVPSINWFSYAFPFLAGHAISSHVMVNNWENGWNMDGLTGTHFIIVYLPQYLEYIGFLLGVTTVWFTIMHPLLRKGVRRDVPSDTSRRAGWVKPRPIEPSTNTETQPTSQKTLEDKPTPDNKPTPEPNETVIIQENPSTTHTQAQTNKDAPKQPLPPTQSAKPMQSHASQIIHKKHEHRQMQHKNNLPSHQTQHKPNPKPLTTPQKPIHDEEKKPDQKEETVFDLSKNQD